MNPPNIFNRYYSTELRTSASQLELDFGTFPPSPLECTAPDETWNLIRVRGFGEAYHRLLIHRAVAKLIDQQGDCLHREPELQEQLVVMRGALDILRGHPRLRAFVLWLMPYIHTAANILSRTNAKEIEAEGGYFSGMRPHDVVVKVGSQKRLNLAAVVSHEHLHLLQNRDNERCERNARNPDQLLSDKALALPQIKYLLEKKEVEARLHECVASFYRSNGTLPLTTSGFFGLLAANQYFGWLITDILERKPNAINGMSISDSGREREFSKQIELILLSFRSPDLERRFVVEVLPVMYGNLLRYYGDQAASTRFIKQITKSDLYTELYGSAPIC